MQYKGLQMDLERPPVGKPEKGLRGIASGYKNEKEEKPKDKEATDF